MHGKLDLAKVKGLKKSELQQLNRLFKLRVPKDKIVTSTLADSVAAVSYAIGHSLSLLMSRRGEIVSITLGQPKDIDMPELKSVRLGPGRLSGHRIIFTHLAFKANRHGKIASLPTINNDNLQCLARNRLDLLVQIEVNPEGQFSRTSGHQMKFADSVMVAHLMPGRDNNGKLWKILPTCTPRKAEEDNFEALILALENEFRRQTPGLVVAEGEERAMLVALIGAGNDAFTIEDELDELAQLSRTAGATVCGRLTQARAIPDPKYFLGAGKIQELALRVQELGSNLVIINDELSPHQQMSLEDVVGVKVIDRTELILDIFAQRARTREGKLQVELAQLKYLYPRLVGKRQSLSRLGGGIGTRGPGETKLEIDRRRIRDRINSLEDETLKIRTYRDVQRRRRNEMELPAVAITGYTNAGKSTLLNALTKSDVFVENKLFATLDPTMRRTTLPNHDSIVLIDTVGFIKKLPTSLISAFKATLEEVSCADILLHVVDASHPNVIEQITNVYDVLRELNAVDRPIITVLNKAELVRSEDLRWLISQVPSPVIVSAIKRFGFGALLTKIQEFLQDLDVRRQKFTA